jgi:sec-independent protein translocase protein TatC
MSKPQPNGNEQPLMAHLLELRDRLLRIVFGMLIVFVPLTLIAREVYAVVAAPLMALMPEGTTMIATEVASPFFAPIKLAAALAFIISMPWTLWQTWSFIAPGLYKTEQRFVAPLMFSSTLLFYVGIAFAYFLVLPTVFGFLIGMAPDGVSVMTDISSYLSFVLTLFIAFGLAFETPVAIVLLVAAGLTTPAKLKSIREYVFIGAFVVGAIFTPPDIISQFMLAVPVYLLFEFGIFISRWITPGIAEVEAQQRETDGPQ